MYRLIESSVVPGTFDADDLALPLAGVEATAEADQADYRLILLKACAAQIEHRVGALWWPRLDGGVAAARRTTAVIEADSDYSAWDRAFPWMPVYPHTQAVTGVAVRRWAGGAWSAIPSVETWPGGRWRISDSGSAVYQITAEATPAAEGVPPEGTEALNRIFGWLDSRRPVWSKGESAPAPSLSGAMMKSGAASVLRPWMRYSM